MHHNDVQRFHYVFVTCDCLAKCVITKRYGRGKTVQMLESAKDFLEREIVLHSRTPRGGMFIGCTSTGQNSERGDGDVYGLLALLQLAW